MLHTIHKKAIPLRIAFLLPGKILVETIKNKPLGMYNS